MSDDSASSTIEDEEKEEERRTRGGTANGMARRLKALFCCLKREPRAERTVEYDPDEYDYVVEKLVVRRVPLALFAIPADLADNASRSTSSSVFGGTGRVANATREASTRPGNLGMDRIANDSLRFAAEENRDSIGGRQDRSRNRLNYRAKSPVRQERIQNRFNTRKPDLKESGCPLEDSPNFSRNRRLFAEDISEVTSSTRTSVSSQTPSSVTIQDDIPTRGDFIHHGFESERKLRAERDETTRESASSGKERDKFVLGWNRKYIVSPFRMRRGSFNLAKPMGVTEDGKSSSHIKESYEDKSSEPTDVKDRDLGSNTAVRWRITIKRQHANATLEHAVSEVRLKTSLSEKICECFRVKNYRRKRTNRI